MIRNKLYDELEKEGYSFDRIIKHVPTPITQNLEAIEIDPDKAMEVYNAFVDRYSEGAQGSEYYNMLNTFDKGVKITVNDSESRIVCYKRIRDDYGNDVYLIHVSEDY